MSRKDLLDSVPEIHPSAFVAHSADLIGAVSIGEEAGSLDAMLNRVADYYEEEVDNKVDALTSLMEPVIIVVLGLLVGGVVVSMYLPIVNLGSAL